MGSRGEESEGEEVEEGGRRRGIPTSKIVSPLGAGVGRRPRVSTPTRGGAGASLGVGAIRGNRRGRGVSVDLVSGPGSPASGLTPVASPVPLSPPITPSRPPLDTGRPSPLARIGSRRPGALPSSSLSQSAQVQPLATSSTSSAKSTVTPASATASASSPFSASSSQGHVRRRRSSINDLLGAGDVVAQRRASIGSDAAAVLAAAAVKSTEEGEAEEDSRGRRRPPDRLRSTSPEPLASSRSRGSAPQTGRSPALLSTRSTSGGASAAVAKGRGWKPRGRW